MGLIDVRDIEEVGTTPLVEELQLEPDLAQRIVDRCTEEAKIVAVEQEAKKAADAKRKAEAAAAFAAGPAAASAASSPDVGGPFNTTGDPLSRGVDAVASANPLLPSMPPEAAERTDEGTDGLGGPSDQTADGEVSRDRMPAAMEAADGGAPETITHKVEAFAARGELSPEERAVNGVEGETPPDDEDYKEHIDEDADTAALAEGRAEPPTTTRDEPV
jgi:hypothetical protein